MQKKVMIMCGDKGGVGKTTTLAWLAAYMIGDLGVPAEQIGILDCDIQRDLQLRLEKGMGYESYPIAANEAQYPEANASALAELLYRMTSMHPYVFVNTPSSLDMGIAVYVDMIKYLQNIGDIHVGALYITALPQSAFPMAQLCRHWVVPAPEMCAKGPDRMPFVSGDLLALVAKAPMSSIDHVIHRFRIRGYRQMYGDWAMRHGIIEWMGLTPAPSPAAAASPAPASAPVDEDVETEIAEEE